MAESQDLAVGRLAHTFGTSDTLPRGMSCATGGSLCQHVNVLRDIAHIRDNGLSKFNVMNEEVATTPWPNMGTPLGSSLAISRAIVAM